MKIYLEMEHDEIQNTIPYGLICETRFGSAWGTMRRKRRWADEFTEKERNAASKLFQQAHDWYLVKGVPETVKMKPETFYLWQKVGDFCGSL